MSGFTGTGNIFEFNNHYYQFVEWAFVHHSTAFSEALTYQYNGITGHFSYYNQR